MQSLDIQMQGANTCILYAVIQLLWTWASRCQRLLLNSDVSGICCEWGECQPCSASKSHKGQRSSFFLFLLRNRNDAALLKKKVVSGGVSARTTQFVCIWQHAFLCLNPAKLEAMKIGSHHRR